MEWLEVVQWELATAWVQEKEGEWGLRWSREGAEFEEVDSRVWMIGHGGDHQIRFRKQRL